MAQMVIIKSTKYGINLVLDPNVDFLQLLHAVAEKFEEAAKFFKDAKVAISFEGRSLSSDEQYCIIDTIMNHSSIHIICVVDAKDVHTSRYKKQIDAYYDAIRGKESEIYKGPLKGEQEIISNTSVVLVGDLGPEARIEAKGNIIVLGTLQGKAYAGTDGDEDCFISALDMQPERLRIGEVAYRGSWRKKLHFASGSKKEKVLLPVKPQIAVIEYDSITIREIDQNILK